jgi:hypothetical protein
MDIEQRPGGSLLLSYDSTLWSRWLFGAAALMAITAVYDLTIGARGDARLIGLAGGIATCLVGGIVMLETSSFTVDASTRCIQWSRRWAFQRRAGRIEFHDIAHVATERPIGDTGIPSRRIVLHLRNGETVPITVGYRPDVGDQISRAAEQLRRVIGHQPVPPVDDSVRALLARGRSVEAIKLLVEEQQLPLRDAKARVERLREERERRG